MTSRKIAIIGGGVAGISTAIALATKGIRSEVFEIRSQPGNIDRGDVLHLRSIHCLQEWGISDQALQRANKLKRFTIYDNSAAELFKIDVAKNFKNGLFFALGHREIEQILWTHATKNELIKIHQSERVKKVIIENNKVKGIQTNNGVFSFDLIIACDGAHSMVRKEYFNRVFYQDYEVKFINVQFRSKVKQEDSGAYAIGKKGTMIYVTLPNQITRFGVQLPKKSKIDQEKIIASIYDIFPSFQLKDHDLLQVKTYNLKRILVKGKSKIEGIFLAGDSFHTFHPTMGFGMNTAIIDAKVLSEILSDNSIADFRKEEALYQKRRLKEVRLIFRLTHIFGHVGSSQNFVTIFLRSMILRFFNRLPFLKKYFIAQLKIDEGINHKNGTSH